MTRIPMIMTYDTALANFRNTVNEKYINNQTPHRTRRNIQEIAQRGRGCDCRQGGRFGGRRGGGRRGRGRGGRNNNTTSGLKRIQTDSTFITLTDGTVIEFHPSFKFADNIFRKFKTEDCQALINARAAYREF